MDSIRNRVKTLEPSGMKRRDETNLPLDYYAFLFSTVTFLYSLFLLVYHE